MSHFGLAVEDLIQMLLVHLLVQFLLLILQDKSWRNQSVRLELIWRYQQLVR
jgi:hypothetical protein